MRGSELQQRLFEDQLRDTEFVGVVEDVADPLFRGRCKVRVWGKFDALATADLPWASPVLPATFAGSSPDGGGGQVSVPKVGTHVRVRFLNGDLYHPEYLGPLNLSSTLSSRLGTDYQGAQVLAWDDEAQLKVLYQTQAGLLVELAGSSLLIEPEGGIVIEHTGSSAIIELRGSEVRVVTQGTISLSAPQQIQQDTQELNAAGQTVNLGTAPIFSALLGEPGFQLFYGLAALIDAKQPKSEGVATGLVTQFKDRLLSQTVRVSP